MALSANFGPFHMKRHVPLLVAMFWLMIGLTLGNAVGVIPDNPTPTHLTSIPLWSWSILWPLMLVLTFTKEALILGVITLAVLLFIRWNWPKKEDSDERIP